MQSSKVLKVLEWAKSFVYWIGRNVKTLLLHILKHPLGSIFWVVKAYFALMFLTLFVACSFGAFASPVVEIKTMPAQKQEIVTCSAHYNGTVLGMFTGKTFPECVTAASPAVSAAIQLPPATSSVLNGTYKATINRTFTVVNQMYDASAAVGYRIVETTIEQQCVGSSTGDVICSSPPPSQYTYSVGGTINLSEKKIGFACPPEGHPEYSLGPSADNLCSIPVPKPQRCWPENGSWQMAPMYHFSDSGVSNLCALNDKGINCPWKKVSTGVYVPAPTSALDCETQKPEPPKTADCSVLANGLKVCPADPNSRCTTKAEPNKVPVVACDPKCGYVNENFACYSHPNEPTNNPDLPDKLPMKTPDDAISDPTKKLTDMLKSDFKDIFGGAEDRLDNIITSSENSQKGNEALLASLNASQRDGNRKLGSIDENTKGINDNTKLIADALAKGEGSNKGGEKPEFEEPTNNWDKRNFGTILKAKGDEIVKQPLFTSINKFFKVSFGGTCPQYAVSVWVFELSIDQFCSPSINALWPYIKAVVLLLCSFVAIRIALL